MQWEREELLDQVQLGLAAFVRSLLLLTMLLNGARNKK